MVSWQYPTDFVCRHFYFGPQGIQKYNLESTTTWDILTTYLNWILKSKVLDRHFRPLKRVPHYFWTLMWSILIIDLHVELCLNIVLFIWPLGIILFNFFNLSFLIDDAKIIISTVFGLVSCAFVSCVWESLNHMHTKLN